MIWSPDRKLWLDELGSPILPLEMALLRPEWGVAADRPWPRLWSGILDLRALQLSRYRGRMVSALDAIGPHIVAGYLSWGGWEREGLPWAHWGGELYDSTRYGGTRPPDLGRIERETAAALRGTPPAYHILREPAWNWFRQGRGATQVAHDLAGVARAIRRGDPDRTRPIVWSEATSSWGSAPGWTRGNFRRVCAEVAPLVDVFGVDVYRSDPLGDGPDWHPPVLDVPELAALPTALSECSALTWAPLEEAIRTDQGARKRFERVGGRLNDPERGYPQAATYRARAVHAAQQWMQATRWPRLVMLAYYGGQGYADGSNGYAPWGLVHDPVTGYWLDLDPEALEITRGAVARARLAWAGRYGAGDHAHVAGGA